MAEKKNRRGLNPKSAATRFKAGGPSPHPAGRPPGSPNRNAIIRKVLGQVVTGEVGGRKKSISVTEASLLKLSQRALSGDLASIKLILALWKEAEDALANERGSEYPFSDSDRQVIEDIYERMKACQEPCGS